MSEVTADALDAEDQKIITLARSTRARVAASEGAAVRDETGRTYTAAAVALPSLRLSALRLAVAMAVSSGAESLEAAALVSDSEPDPGDLAAVRDLGPDRPRLPRLPRRHPPRHPPPLTRPRLRGPHPSVTAKCACWAGKSRAQTRTAGHHGMQLRGSPTREADGAVGDVVAQEPIDQVGQGARADVIRSRA